MHAWPNLFDFTAPLTVPAFVWITVAFYFVAAGIDRIVKAFRGS